jgi:hypothetical protein
MVVYFFDVHDGCRLLRDGTGTPLENADQAWITAGRILLDFLEDSPFPGQGESGYSFVQIRTGRGPIGLVELSLRRSEAVMARREGSPRQPDFMGRGSREM